MKTLSQLAQLLQGVLSGSPDLEIRGINSLEEAGPQEISFLENGKMLPKMQESRGSAFIVPLGIENFDRPIIRVANPRLAFAKALEIFDPRRKEPLGVHPTAVLGDKVSLGENIAIGAGVVIGDEVVIGQGTIIYPQTYIGHGSILGENCIIHPRVVIEERVEIGSRVIIQAGAVIGSDGFGFVTIGKGQHYKIPHIGKVIIEDDAEIGANVAIDRGTVGNTVVKKGTKIDNLVHLAHNVTVGEGCFLVAQVGISGSTKIGDRVTLAGQAGTVGHISIGDDCIIAARGGVTGNVPAGSFYSGFPAREHKEQLKKDAALQRLPETLKVVKEMKKRLERLENKEGE